MSLSNCKSLSYIISLALYSGASASAERDLMLKNHIKPLKQEHLTPAINGFSDKSYEIKRTYGNSSNERVNLKFYNININPDAYIEVSDPERNEVYLYGYKDYGHLKSGEYFTPLSIDGGYAVVKVIYPKNIEIKPEENIDIEAWGYEPLPMAAQGETCVPDGKKPDRCMGLVDLVDNREDAACATNNNSLMLHGSLATAHVYGRCDNSSAYLCLGTAWSFGNKNFFITNNHVIKNNDIMNLKEIRFQSINSECNRPSIKNILKLTPEKFIDTHSGANYKDHTLFTINNFDYKNINFKYLFGGLSLQDYKVDIDTPGYIPQHGTKQQQSGSTQVQRISNIKDDKACKVIRFDANGMRHNCDTPPGSSGSAMLSQDTNDVIALVWGAASKVGGYNFATNSDIILNDFKRYISDSNVPITGTGNVTIDTKDIYNDGDVIVPNIPIYDASYFEPFAGKIQHYNNYSTLTVNGQSIKNENENEIIYRLSQLDINSSKEYNLSKPIANKKLKIKYLNSDNKLTEEGPLKTWLGLKIKRAGSDVLIGNLLFKVNNYAAKPGEPGGSEEIEAMLFNAKNKTCLISKDKKVKAIECDQYDDFQRWKYTDKGFLKNIGNNLCMKPQSFNKGAEIFLSDCENDDKATEWRLVYNKGIESKFSIVPVLDDKKELGLFNNKAIILNFDKEKIGRWEWTTETQSEKLEVHITGDDIVSSGQKSSLSAEISGGHDLTYQWSIPNGFIATELDTQELIFTAPQLDKTTDFTFTLEVADKETKENATDSYSVKVKAKETLPPPTNGVLMQVNTYNEDYCAVSKQGVMKMTACEPTQKQQRWKFEEQGLLRNVGDGLCAQKGQNTDVRMVDCNIVTTNWEHDNEMRIKVQDENLVLDAQNLVSVKLQMPFPYRPQNEWILRDN